MSTMLPMEVLESRIDIAEKSIALMRNQLQTRVDLILKRIENLEEASHHHGKSDEPHRPGASYADAIAVNPQSRADWLVEFQNENTDNGKLIRYGVFEYRLDGKNEYRKLNNDEIRDLVKQFEESKGD